MHLDITKITSKKYLKLIQLTIKDSEHSEKKLIDDRIYLETVDLKEFDNLDKKSIIDLLTLDELRTFKEILLDYYLTCSLKAISFQGDLKYSNKLIQQIKKK